LSTIFEFCLLLTLLSQGPEPIRLHPENPRWFLWRGEAVALITSAEHYGAVLNVDFDYVRYLETLQQDGMNYSRVFAGGYVEPPGAFGIQRNTLAPAPGRFLAPWARSDQPGYAGGGTKFDLDRFNSEYLARLKSFLAEAGWRGVVVELTFFSSTYGEKQWAVHPLNPANNIQAVVVPDWKKLHTSDNGAALAVQERLVRWLVRELNGYDNLFYEIQNEPWSDNHVMGDQINPYLADKPGFPNAVEITTAPSVAWQRTIARAIADEESRLPRKHLVAQNVANFRLPVCEDDLVQEVGILNFHYAYPEVVEWNRGWNRVIGYDESGFAGREDLTYRRQAWNFVFSGGGLFNSLDYSFTVGREDGTDVGNEAPGGGSPDLRRQLSVLSRFLHSFDLATLRPDCTFVLRAPGVVTRVLSNPGTAYALYVQGRGPTTLTVQLPAGRWSVTWSNVEDGDLLKEENVLSEGTPLRLASPDSAGDMALRIVHE